MQLLGCTPPREPDPERDEAQRAYQSEKLAAWEAHAERVARLKRLGYEVDLAKRKDDAPD